MDPGLHLTTEMGATTDEHKNFMLTVPYLSAVGALLYLDLTSHSDISNSVGILSHFSANPGSTGPVRLVWTGSQRVHVDMLCICSMSHHMNTHVLPSQTIPSSDVGGIPTLLFPSNF